MEKTSCNEDAVKYLCRYDSYQDMDEEDKTHIVKIMKLFDLKDNVQKSLLKNIIENDYINTDTGVTVNLGKGEEAVKAVFCAKAKQQILEKYKFPLCMDFLAGFEEALTSPAATSGTSGIKLTGRNNKALQYKIEVKLMGHDDRLFSSMNDFKFDIFSQRGLH